MDTLKPTYAFYKDTYGGRLSKDRFDTVLSEAVATVGECVCRPVVAANLAVYQDAVCAVCDVVDSPAVSSYSAGKVSESYTDVEAQGRYRVAARHLAPAVPSLIYSGL